MLLLICCLNTHQAFKSNRYLVFCCCRKESAKRRRMIPSACPASTSRWESESLLSAPECIPTINFNPSAWLRCHHRQPESCRLRIILLWLRPAEEVTVKEYTSSASLGAVIVINSGFSSAHQSSIYTLYTTSASNITFDQITLKITCLKEQSTPSGRFYETLVWILWCN